MTRVLTTWLASLFLAVAARGGGVTRTLPASYLPSEPVVVSLAVVPTPGIDVFAVEEFVPPGWVVNTISHLGALDAAQNKVKWGPFLDDAIRTLTFIVVPPASARETVAFAGLAAFGSEPFITIGGNGALALPVDAVVRTVVPEFVPGTTYTILLSATPHPLAGAWGVEEQPPDGWSVVAVLDGGGQASPSQRIKWGPFHDTIARVLRYQIRAPANAPESASFQGIAAFDERIVPISGGATIPRTPDRLDRVLPPHYAPGVPFSLQLNASPSPVTQAYAVEQTLPTGWTAADISHDGHWDPATRKIKWGPFYDSSARSLTFQTTAPATERTSVALPGLGVFDDRNVSAGGDVTLTPEPHLLARSAPVEVATAAPFTVTVQATPARHVRSYAIEEAPPRDWIVGAISSGGSFDSATGKVKWGPFDDGDARSLSYTLTAPASAGPSGAFEGRGAFDTDTVDTGGDRTTVRRRGVVLRDLPDTYRESTPTTVTLVATPSPDERAYAMEEQVPLGWTVSDPSHGGIQDVVTGKLKWGPFQDAIPRTLTYTAHPPAVSFGPQLFSGTGAFDAIAVPVGGDTATSLRSNRAPIVLPISAGRPPDRSIKIALAKVLARASDPDGDELTVISAHPTSDAGATVLLAGAFVAYLPAPGFNGPDRFLVTVQDGRGAQEVLSVFIEVLPPADVFPPNAVSVTALPGGSVRVLFLGIPGYSYLVQASQNLTTWVTLGDRIANSVGFFEWIDTEAPLYPGRFYRSISP